MTMVELVQVFDLEREADGLPLQVCWSLDRWQKVDVRTGHLLARVHEAQFDRRVQTGSSQAHEFFSSDREWHARQSLPQCNARCGCGTIHALSGKSYFEEQLKNSNLVQLLKGGLNQFVGKMEILAGLFSACIHDFEHIGRTFNRSAQR